MQCTAEILKRKSLFQLLWSGRGLEIQNELIEFHYMETETQSILCKDSDFWMTE